MKRLVLGAVALVSACGGGEAPTIAAFTADRAMVGLGDRVNLTWDVTGATEIGVVAQPGGVLIEGSDALSSTVMSGPIAAATRFILTAKNADLQATAEVSVTVDATVLRITRFQATPAAIEPGGTATLDWTVAGSPIGKVKLLDGDGATLFEGTSATGSKDVSPTSFTIYRLEVSNIAQTVTATTGVVVQELPPEIVSFDAMPNPAPTGTRGSVTWQTSRADEVQISRDATVIRPWNANGAAMGFTSFTFDRPMSVFKFEARNAFGTVQRELTVTTLPQPAIETFEVTPLRFTTATATVGIRWNVRDAMTVELEVEGAVPVGFTGQTMGNITITLTRTASIVLTGHSTVGDVMDAKTVHKVAVYTQDVVGEGGALEGAAVRVEDAAGVRFFEGVTDINGRASIDIDADMTTVSVSAAKAGFSAMAFVGVATATHPTLRLDRLPAAPPMPPPPAAIEGTIFGKSSLDAQVVISGEDFSQVATTGITYMSDYQVTNAPLSLIAVDFGRDNVVVNATVTAPIARSGAMISQSVTFSRPGPMVVTTSVDLVLPVSGIFPSAGEQFTSGYLPALRQLPGRDDAVLVGWGAITQSPGHILWNVTSFDDPRLAPDFAYVAANGQSLQLLAAVRRFGADPAIQIGPVDAFDFSPDQTRMLDARIDFDAPSYDALEMDVGDPSTTPPFYRVFFIGQTLHARVPRLPSTVRLRDIGVGPVGSLPVMFQMPAIDHAKPWELAPSLRPPFALEYTLRSPVVEYGVMGF